MILWLSGVGGQKLEYEGHRFKPQKGFLKNVHRKHIFCSSILQHVSTSDQDKYIE